MDGDVANHGMSMPGLSKHRWYVFNDKGVQAQNQPVIEFYIWSFYSFTFTSLLDGIENVKSEYWLKVKAVITNSSWTDRQGRERIQSYTILGNHPAKN